MVWTVGEVVAWAAGDFGKRGMDQPRLEADVLLAYVLGCQRIELYTEFDRPLADSDLNAYREAISLRRAGHPSAYIVGSKEFWSLDFEVNPTVMVPRPETETLVQAALDRCRQGPILDLCTGSGCVAVALASELPDVEIDAVDISDEACETARRNVERHRLEDRVRLFCGDLFAPLPDGRRYAAIVSNPPYVADAEIAGLCQEVRKEPEIALAGGVDGLDVVRRIADQARERLLPGGWLLVEIDPGQATETAREIGKNIFGKEGEVVRDLSGRERVVAMSAGS